MRMLARANNTLIESTILSRLLALIIFGFAITFFNTSNTSAQAVRLETALDTSQVKIGQWARYTINATHDTSTILNWPYLSDSLQGLEIVNKSKIDTSIKGNVVNKRQTIAVTSFDSGYYVIPPLLFSYRTKGVDKLDTTKTTPSKLRVQGVAVDTSKAIRPIADIREVPYTLAELWPYLLGGLLTIGLIILGYYIYKRWQQQPEQPKTPVKQPERPAHEVAFEKLQELENKKLWQSGEIKQYYIELSDIFRDYLERRYKFQALEITTGDIIHELKDKLTDAGVRQEAKEVLELSDFVKFAKYVPNADENQEVLQKTYDFIRNTKQKPETSDHEKDEKQSDGNEVEQNENTEINSQ